MMNAHDVISNHIGTLPLVSRSMVGCIAPRTPVAIVRRTTQGIGLMRQAVTFRLNSELLAEARRCAADENRTLTNFMETLLKRHLMALQVRAPVEQQLQNNEARRDA